MINYYKDEDTFNAIEYNGNNMEAIEVFVRAKQGEDKHVFYLSLEGSRMAIARESKDVSFVQLNIGDWIVLGEFGYFRKRTAEEMSKCSVAIDSVSVKFNVKTN